MKFLKSFPAVSVKASPLSITQDIGQRSKITLESDSFCTEFLAIKLKLTGSAVVGTDFILVYEDNTLIPYRNLTTNENLIELYLFNSSNVLNFYLLPLSFNTLTTKKVEIYITPEPRVYFSKVSNTLVTLNASNSLCIQDFITSPHTSSTGLILTPSSRVDVAESQLQVQSSYVVIEDTTHPTVQFGNTSYNFGDTITVNRLGDLSQNSVVKMYKSTTPLVDAPSLYLIFSVGQNSIDIPVSTLQMTSEFSLLLSPFNNANIGTNSITTVT